MSVRWHCVSTPELVYQFIGTVSQLGTVSQFLSLYISSVAPCLNSWTSYQFSGTVSQLLNFISVQLHRVSTPELHISSIARCLNSWTCISVQWQVDQEQWEWLLCYEQIMKGGRILSLARLQCLISSSHLKGLMHCHLYCWTLDLMIQMTGVQFHRKCLLKLSFVISCFLQIFCQYKYICFVCRRRLSGSTLAILTFSLWVSLS